MAFNLGNLKLDEIVNDKLSGIQMDAAMEAIKPLFEKGLSIENICEVCKHIPKETVIEIYNKLKNAKKE